MGKLVDSHCHLHKPWFDQDLDEIISRAHSHNVSTIINCASHPDNYEQVLSSARYEEISVTLGLQPTLADEYPTAEILHSIDDLESKVIAIGEIGLDYYWVKEDKRRKQQEKTFISCLKLANNLNLPVVIHTRKAESESLEVLEKYAETPVLLHSFDGNLKEINRAKDLGYKITVPTIVTRRRNRRKVTQRAGLDNIMLETDSPFCTTQDDIERNEPMYIEEAAKYVSQLLEVEFEEVAEITTRNAFEFHNL